MTVHPHDDFIVLPPLGDPDTGTMVVYPTQSYYFDTALTNSWSISLMQRAWLDSNKYKFYMLLVWLGWDSNSRPFTWEACAVPIDPAE